MASRCTSALVCAAHTWPDRPRVTVPIVTAAAVPMAGKSPSANTTDWALAAELEADPLAPGGRGHP